MRETEIEKFAFEFTNFRHNRLEVSLGKGQLLQMSEVRHIVCATKYQTFCLKFSLTILNFEYFYLKFGLTIPNFEYFYLKFGPVKKFFEKVVLCQNFKVRCQNFEV